MKKGFTLIELLAVIVILAIIALIATPIILGIINDARKESNERSAELYASAVRNAIASYQLTHPTAPTSFDQLNIQYDGDVVCTTEELYADGNFYIADCTVNGIEVDYIYGEQQVTQAYKPQYYSYTNFGEINGDLPNDAKTTASELNLSYSYYVGFDIDANNKITDAYVCFVKNATEYCLKGYDSSAAVKNIDVIKDAYAADIDSCSLGTDNAYCYVDGIEIIVGSSGNIHAYDGSNGCFVFDYGIIECR